MWTYNNIRIFVQTVDGKGSRISARLQPLAGGTVVQFFGHETPTHKLSAFVVGDTDLEALKGMCETTSTSYLLVGDNISANFYLSSISWSRQRTVSQTLRPDLDCDAPVYMVEMELYE